MLDILCPDSIAGFLHLFDLSLAPKLLFYSYIPVILVSLCFGLYVLFKDHFSLQSKALLGMSVTFSLLTLNEILQWIGAYASLVHFAWQLSALFQLLTFFATAYFFFVFLYKSHPSFLNQLIFLVASLPILILLPTEANMSYFDLTNCEAVNGPLWSYIYILGITILVWIIFVAIQRLKTISDKSSRKQIIYLTLATSIFLILFIGSSFLGDITLAYDVNLIAPIGEILFLGFITYMIVKFKTFHIKLLSAQALVATLVILVGSIIFVRTIESVRIITVITLFIVLILGIRLVKSVKKEVEQRERIEKLAHDLEQANNKLRELDKLKSEFLSFASHQIRSPLTAIDGYASMLLEGDFGEMPPKIGEAIKVMDTSSKSLIKIVNEFLDVSRIEQGRMKYDMSDFDAKELVKEVVNELRPNVETKGLSFEFLSDQLQNYQTFGDRGKIKQVIGNIVDNSIKYTPEGGIKVGINKKIDNILISVSDTGIGIEQDEIPKLFSMFTRAKEAHKTNVSGTGLGLYVAKQMIEAHKGKIWVESSGKGKGSTFFIELPAKG